MDEQSSSGSGSGFTLRYPYNICARGRLPAEPVVGSYLGKYGLAGYCTDLG